MRASITALALSLLAVVGAEVFDVIVGSNNSVRGLSIYLRIGYALTLVCPPVELPTVNRDCGEW